MPLRRVVRVTDSFFDRLDELFPPNRTTAGGPSATDVLLHEMPPVMDRLATDFEQATHPVADRSDLRVLVTAGMLVPFLAIYAVTTEEGAIEILYLETDLSQ